jgi:hypothetical protein
MKVRNEAAGAAESEHFWIARCSPQSSQKEIRSGVGGRSVCLQHQFVPESIYALATNLHS